MDKNYKITVYVKSVKTVTGTQEIERELIGPYVGHAPSRIGLEGKRSDGTFRLRQFEKIVEPEYKFILPDDQQSFVETVKEVASPRGIEVEVVDVTKENLLKREIQKHVKDLSVYPTVMTDDGRRVEGNVTRVQLEEFLA